MRFFVSYAHDNDKGRTPLGELLLQELRTQFEASRKYKIDLWVDRSIRLGHGWHEQIQLAIQESDFGLFLVSPAFLGSGYIGQNELPHFVGDAPNLKPVIPVGLVPIVFGEGVTICGDSRSISFISVPIRRMNSSSTTCAAQLSAEGLCKGCGNGSRTASTATSAKLPPPLRSHRQSQNRKTTRQITIATTMRPASACICTAS